MTPPPELVQEWMTEIWHEGTPVRVAASDLHIANQAARWGADQELEACCREVQKLYGVGRWLRSTRRIESLKEQALALLDYVSDRLDAVHENTIRRALEQLDD